MRIVGENCAPLSPSSSGASNSSADEMIENENHSLRDRVGDLEKKVHEQNDEIMCLRSTLADVLRRLTIVETSSKLGVGGGRVTPTKEDRGTVRLRHHHNSGGGEGGGARDVSKRASSYVPARPASSTANISRRGAHYQSTSSLYSDGHSSSSVSPAPSPSPTAAPSSSTPHHHHHHHHHLPARHISTSSSPFSSPTRPSQLGALNKRWVSTSDFATPSRAATAYAHSPTPTNTLLAASLIKIRRLQRNGAHHGIQKCA